MLAGLRPPSRGCIRYDGRDISDDLNAYKALVGSPAVLTTVAVALCLTRPPEPPPLVDADHEHLPLALRLY